MSKMEVKRDPWCRHRTAFGPEFKVCKAGIGFHQFEGHGMDAMPCLGGSDEVKAKCPSFAARTPQEIAEREERLTGRLKRMGVIRMAIIAEHETSGANSGTMPCPACEDGTVSWSRARSNGHVHARCSTPGCASWME